MADGVAQLADQLGALDAAMPQVPDESELAGLANLGPQLEQVLGVLGTACVTPEALDPAVCGALPAIAQELAGLQGTLGDLPGTLETLRGVREQVAAGSQGVQALADAAGSVADGSESSAAGQHQLAAGLDQLKGAADQVATGAGGLADGARGLQSGVSQLAGGASGLSSGASQLSEGVGQLATGASGVAGGAGDLADGVGQLAGGAGDLAGGLGQAVDQIPSYSDGERATLASVVANPVEAPSETALDTGSTGPLFAVVALWLGALALTTAVRPSRSRALLGTRGAVRVALEDLALPTAIAAGTGAVVGGVLAGVEHLSPLGWIGAVVLGGLVSVVFVAVHQGFCLLLRDYARGVSLLMAVLVIATGVIATVPRWLAGIADWLSIGAARRALVALVVPGAGGAAAAVASLVVWGIAGLALAVLATSRARTTRVSRLLATA